MSDKFSIIYDGINLANIVDGFTKIDRSIGSAWNNVFQEKINGSDFLYNGISSKKLSIDFIFYGSTIKAAVLRKKLAEFLNKKEPCPLSYSDEPNIQYLALPDGEQPFSLDFIKGEGTLNFIVPSGTAESTYNAVVSTKTNSDFGTIIQNSDGSLTAKIKNKGTLESYPTIKVIHTDEDNGYVGIVNENGVMELGNKLDLDGENYKQSEILINAETESGFAPFVPGTTNPNLPGRNGKLAWNKDGFELSELGSGNTWHGGALEWTLPADSEGHVGALNFHAQFNILTVSSAKGQTGQLRFWFYSADNIPVCMFEVSKTDATGTTGHVNYWRGTGSATGGTWGTAVELYKYINFDTSGLKANNNPSGGQAIIRMGENIDFYLWAKPQRVVVPELKNIEVSKVVLTIDQYAQRTKAQMINQFRIRRFKFTKLNVEKWRDVPNRYMPGDTLQIDMNEGKVLQNTIGANDQLITGSEFFALPSGESELDLVFSDFMSKPPDVEISWKERYL